MSKIKSLVKEYLNTPAKAGVLLSMVLWSFTIRAALATRPVNKILPWVTHFRRQINLPPEHILRYLYWLKKLRVIKRRGDCLARSLIYYRFLSLADEKPIMFIGFKDQEGHAWVEVDGQVINESPNANKSFTPTLVLLPGATEFSPIQ